MDWFEQNWPIVAVIGFVVYALVTCVLHVIAGRFLHEIAVHDRIRESKALRFRYLASIQAKHARDASGTGR